jgi:hypothetical protein
LVADPRRSGVVIAVVADGVAPDPTAVCKLCRVMPEHHIRSAIDGGADVVLLADCAPPTDIAAALSHGLRRSRRTRSG